MEEYKDDQEKCELKAEKVMCDVLDSLGYGAGVKVFKEAGFGYDS